MTDGSAAEKNENGKGKPRDYVLVMRDVTERKLLENKLSALAISKVGDTSPRAARVL